MGAKEGEARAGIDPETMRQTIRKKARANTRATSGMGSGWQPWARFWHLPPPLVVAAAYDLVGPARWRARGTKKKSCPLPWPRCVSFCVEQKKTLAG
jgi:hypothetical protein